MKHDPKQPWLMQAALLTAVPLMLVTGPVCGYFIGRFLDQTFQTGPSLMIVFTLMGGIAGVREMMKLIKRIS